MPKHTNDINPCPACELKLITAHSDLSQWFRIKVKPRYHDCHISWSWRDKTAQNQAHSEGKSQLAWPMSAHNKLDDQGNPCSLAIDFFRLCTNGMASWEWAYFKAISLDAKSSDDPIKWGGDWKSIGDSDHFQLILKS